MHLLLTRPKSDHDPLPELLRARGHTTAHDPLLRIDLLPPPKFDPARLQAIAVTSSNALRAIDGTETLASLLTLPVFAVGDATAAAARTMGFAQVRTGGGAAADLLPTILGATKTENGAVLYLRGETVAFDLAAPLTAAGLTVIAAVVYRAVAAKAFAPETIAGLVRGTISGVVLTSPRSAETYAHLAEIAGLAGEVAHIPHFCLSARVAAGLSDLADSSVRIARRPNLQELVALIDLDATQS